MKRKSEDCFNYFYLVFMTIITFLENFTTAFPFLVELLKILKIFGILLSLVCIINKKMSRKNLMILFLMLFYMFLTYIKSGHQFLYLITNVIGVYIIKDMSLSKAFKSIFYAQVMLFSILCFCLLAGIIDNQIIYRVTNDGVVVARNCLGFVHPNTAFWNYFSMIAIYLYLKFDKLKFVHILVVVVSSVILYGLTDSRSGLLCVFLYLIFVLIAKYKSKILNNFIVRNIMKYQFLFFSILSIVPAYLYSRTNYQMIHIMDRIMSNRIYLSNLLYQRYNIGIFGQTVALYDGRLRLTIDNGYVYMSVAFGIVFLILFAFLYTKLIKKLYKDKKYIEIVSILIFNIYTLSEKMFMNSFTNFTIFFFVFLLYNQVPKLEKKNINNI